MRRPLLIAVAAAATALVPASCAGDDAASRSSTTGSGSSTSTSTTADPARWDECPVGADAGAPYGAGRRRATYVDSTRGTNAVPSRNLAARPDRTLPVTILYPTDAGGPGAGTGIADDAAPASGRFPWVVYSHGVLSSGDERNDVLADWVRRGYVVVAPTYPLSSGQGLEVADLPNQGRDVGFVVDRFRAMVADAEDTLSGHVRADCLALVGHSMGAATTLLATYDPCCDSTGARAAVAISGFFAPTSGPPDAASLPRTPLMLVHGARDPVVPIARGLTTFDELPGPRWFVTVAAGDHNSLFEPPESAALDDAVVSFLDAELRGERAALDGLPSRLAPAGVTVVARPGT